MKPVHIEVICIGTELLNDRDNTHTVTIGKFLSSIGLEITQSHTVGDDRKQMQNVFESSLKRADVVMTSGGLGPTFDDLTREVWSKAIRRPLQYVPFLVNEIKKKFESRGIQMPKENRRQGFLLKGADILPNNFGTAPGQYLGLGKKRIILLPGPKRELVPILENFVLPRLILTYPGWGRREKKFHLLGVPESKVDEWLRPFVKKHQKIFGCSIDHGLLANQSIITVKFKIRGQNNEKVQKAAQFLESKLPKALHPYIFGTDDQKLEEVVGDLLKSKKRLLALAESCTGGLVAKILTDVPGSSQFFKEGFVTYSNQSKISRLGVSSIDVKRYGAVSEPVCRSMAKGLRKISKVDYSLSITGIAGPEGGSPAKPIGTVYIGCSGPRRTMVKKYQFNGDRAWIRHRSAIMALDLLRREILHAS